MKSRTKLEASPNVNGFTVVELLVVIVTVAILAAMLLPALAGAKMRSTLDLCLNNQKQFAVASVMFSGDHGDYLVSAGQNNKMDDNLFSWRVEPSNLNGAPQSVPAGQTSQFFYDRYGFQVGGLYPYIKNADVIHCPADTRYLNSAGWCSYSMVDNMNGTVAPSSGTDYRVHKLSQIQHPNARMVVNEENDLRGEYAPDGSIVYENIATWEPYGNGYGGNAPNPKTKFTTMENGGTAGWYDGPTDFHSTGATFSFCDGHAEFHKWQDTTTFLFASNPPLARESGKGSGTASLGRDTFWVYSHIATTVWP